VRKKGEETGENQVEERGEYFRGKRGFV